MHEQNLPLVSRVLRTLFVGLVLLISLIPYATALAADLPLASGSNLAGFAFNDRPIQLPIERNFQMAMITASGDIGRSCGKIEAYGWRLSPNDQLRVNQIFNDTVNGLRDLGYRVEPQTPTSVSRDVTLITADRPNRHFILMWSAGDIGLVMTMCDSSGTLHNRNATAYDLPAPQFSPQAQTIVTSALEKPSADKPAPLVAEFSPAGDWIGSYTCHQGYTGGTLHIAHVEGKNFDGTFRFYPTPKNSSVPAGSYHVYGQYDMQSKRVLINPGQWIERPRNFYNTILVGVFDTDKRTFSGYFQGITGCTSFEANYAGSDLTVTGKPSLKPTKNLKHKKKATATVKKVAMPSSPPETPISIVPDQAPPGLVLPNPAPATAPNKSSANEPRYKDIVLAASGGWYTPSAPQAPQAPTYTPQAPSASLPPVISPIAPSVTQPPQVPQVSNYNTSAPQLPTAATAQLPSNYNTIPPQLPAAPQVPQVSVYTTQAPTAPQPQSVTIGSGAQ